MFRVTREAIDLQGLVDFVTDPEAGAIVTFIGTTRNNNEGRKVIALDYEAYPEMAEKELARLGEEAKKRWDIRRMAIVHRIGPVQITESAASPLRRSKKASRSGRRSSLREGRSG